MTSEAIQVELAFRDPTITIGYLEEHGSRITDNQLMTIIDAHLSRKSTSQRFIQEKRWAELTTLLEGAYAYYTAALVKEACRHTLTRDEIAQSGARCSIVRILADIARTRIQNG